MKRPATKIMVMGHPIVAVPMTLANGVILVAGFRTGNVVPVVIAIALIAGVQNARVQASAYRAWQAEWEAMGDGPTRRSVTPGGVLGVAVIATLMLVAFSRPQLLAYMAGYAVGWIGTQPWLLALLGLLALAVLVQFVRHFRRRAKPTKPVIVIAQAILPVPTLADAYRALPPYCHALLRGQQ
jgi:hypothetical protein